jgi:voltage-gated potassium channel
VNGVIVVVALLSVALALAEVVPYLHRFVPTLLWVEWPTTIFFTAEYILRLSVADRKWKYVMSPLGLIDLASFVPTYLGLGSFGFLKAARFIRLARLSRIANLSNVSKVVKKGEQ